MSRQEIAVLIDALLVFARDDPGTRIGGALGFASLMLRLGRGMVGAQGPRLDGLLEGLVVTARQLQVELERGSVPDQTIKRLHEALVTAEQSHGLRGLRERNPEFDVVLRGLRRASQPHPRPGPVGMEPPPPAGDSPSSPGQRASPPQGSNRSPTPEPRTDLRGEVPDDVKHVYERARRVELD